MSKSDLTKLAPLLLLGLIGVLVVNFVVTGADIPTGLLSILGVIAGSLFVTRKTGE